MAGSELTREAGFGRRFVGYLGQRFPVPVYALLIGALVAGAAGAAEAGRTGAVGVGWHPVGAFVTALLVFFHLRVFDEFKDFEQDRLAHPQRLLSRGVISLRELGWAGGLVLAVQAVVNGVMGATGVWEVVPWWVATVAFSVLMRFEFGLGEWLRRRLVLYALLHNPIVALLMLYVDAVHRQGRSFGWLAVGFVAVASFTSLGFEVGRKLRAPSDELDGQDTYTKALGTTKASVLLMLVMLAAGVAAAVTAHLGHVRMWAVATVVAVTLLALIPVVAFMRRPDARGAKRAEAASSAYALVLYVVPVVDLVLRRGVTWSG